MCTVEALAGAGVPVCWVSAGLSALVRGPVCACFWCVSCEHSDARAVHRLRRTCAACLHAGPAMLASSQLRSALRLQLLCFQACLGSSVCWHAWQDAWLSPLSAAAWHGIANCSRVSCSVQFQCCSTFFCRFGLRWGVAPEVWGGGRMAWHCLSLRVRQQL